MEFIKTTMGFKKIPGLPGKVYVPENIDQKIKKHNCRDCYSCRWCADLRCELCLNQTGKGKYKLECTKIKK